MAGEGMSQDLQATVGGVGVFGGFGGGRWEAEEDLEVGSRRGEMETLLHQR